MRGTSAARRGMIFRDKGMVLSMILWAVLVVLILYGVPDVRIVGGV